MSLEQTFAFGENWRRFLKRLDEERFRSGEASLKELFNLENLHGRSFLDIGCGSGLFSHAAYRLGAARIVSFDVDPFSVECTRYLHQRAGVPPHWQVLQGSVLDGAFVTSLGSFDIVYAWGSLHHTGKVWEALCSATRPVSPGGCLGLAVYNRVSGLMGSKLWLWIKKTYNAASRPARWAIENAYIALWFAGKLARLKNPLAIIKNHKSNRGMDWQTDIRDWLGGYPYEFAGAEEVIRFMKMQAPDFELAKLRLGEGFGNNEYVFRRAKS